ncbi:hypothetical protein M0813_08558 [Anaeramoeba flamelloides]|uniref:Uncharacterized protein n=1 Tax=Anaeramoeba flamelloides TaxID=1746091 RepID=A0ABQ8X8P4_9EUKA|nr:hypothetical protein M0813_08558 [Anaeramoeba flamelloides]
MNQTNKNKKNKPNNKKRRRKDPKESKNNEKYVPIGLSSEKQSNVKSLKHKKKSNFVEEERSISCPTSIECCLIKAILYYLYKSMKYSKIQIILNKSNKKKTKTIQKKANKVKGLKSRNSTTD